MYKNTSVPVATARRQLQAAISLRQEVTFMTFMYRRVSCSQHIRIEGCVISSHHVVGVLRLDEGRKEVDPLLDCLIVTLGLAGLVQEIPGKDGGVLLVQQAVVGVAPAGRALWSCVSRETATDRHARHSPHRTVQDATTFGQCLKYPFQCTFRYT